MTEAVENKDLNVKPVTPENLKRGVLMSLLAIPAGIVLWVIVWQLGYVASIVSFVIAWLAVYLYKVGAGSPASRRSAPYLVAVIALGVVLSFVAGMVSDAMVFYVQGTSDNPFAMLYTSGFWAYFADNFFNNSELWSSYVGDILMTLVFAGLGTFVVIRNLFVTKKVVETQPA